MGVERIISMDKVIWTEGLFLRPQHFQQMERYLEHYAHAGRRAAQPFCWGFETLIFRGEPASTERAGRSALLPSSW